MNYYWIKFPVAEIRHFLDTYSENPIAVLNYQGYVFRDNYEMGCFFERNPKAVLIFK